MNNPSGVIEKGASAFVFVQSVRARDLASDDMDYVVYSLGSQARTLSAIDLFAMVSRSPSAPDTT